MSQKICLRSAIEPAAKKQPTPTQMNPLELQMMQIAEEFICGAFDR
jgi:hypothetical protein